MSTHTGASPSSKKKRERFKKRHPEGRTEFARNKSKIRIMKKQKKIKVNEPKRKQRLLSKQQKRIEEYERQKNSFFEKELCGKDSEQEVEKVDVVDDANGVRNEGGRQGEANDGQRKV